MALPLGSSAKTVQGWNVPSPLPRQRLSPSEPVLAISSLPSPLKSATAASYGMLFVEASICACSCDELINVVVRELRFHRTTEVWVKAVPFTVNVKAGPPGITVVGTKGWLTKGTGLAACNDIAKAKGYTRLIRTRRTGSSRVGVGGIIGPTRYARLRSPH